MEGATEAFNTSHTSQLHDVPFICIAATTKDENRKPDTGMWGCLQAYFESLGCVRPGGLNFLAVAF